VSNEKKKTPEDLVVGRTYTAEELEEIFDIDNLDERLKAGERIFTPIKEGRKN